MTWSASRLLMYLRCPEQYRRRYVMGDIIPPGVAQVRGQTVHAVAAEALRRQQAGRSMTAEEARDLAATHWDSIVAAEGFRMTVSDQEEGISPGVGKDQAVQGASVYVEHVAPTIDPLWVETKVTLRAEVEVVGVIDCLERSGTVRELKTSTRRPRDGVAETSVQLTLYAALADQALGEGESRPVVYDAVVVGPRPTVVSLRSRRTVEDRRRLERTLAHAIRGIQAGAFPPAHEGAWWCAPKWCGYWSTCPYRGGVP